MTFQELRFDVRDTDVTHVYVLIEGLDDWCRPGWHHKAFPANMPVLTIMQAWAVGDEDPRTWPLQAPEVSA